MDFMKVGVPHDYQRHVSPPLTNIEIFNFYLFTSPSDPWMKCFLDISAKGCMSESIEDVFLSFTKHIFWLEWRSCSFKADKLMVCCSILF